jgi:hypothetical protein
MARRSEAASISAACAGETGCGAAKNGNVPDVQEDFEALKQHGCAKWGANGVQTVVSI